MCNDACYMLRAAISYRLYANLVNGCLWLLTNSHGPWLWLWLCCLFFGWLCAPLTAQCCCTLSILGIEFFSINLLHLERMTRIKKNLYFFWRSFR